MFEDFRGRFSVADVIKFQVDANYLLPLYRKIINSCQAQAVATLGYVSPRTLVRAP